MKNRTLLIAGGAAALSLALIALPSSSAPSHSPSAQSQEAPAPPQEPADQELSRLQNLLISLDGESGSWLGVETQEVSPENVKEWKLPAERGVVIGKVLPDSPAAKAGLKENDVVTQINGQNVEGALQFRRMIHEIPAGRKVQLTVWRDGHSQTIEATLGKSEEGRRIWRQAAPRAFAFRMPEMPEIPEMHNFDWNGDLLSPSRPRLGIEAEDLDGQLGSYFGAPDAEGILVRSVSAESPAEKAGIKAGDVITSLNGERLHSVSELREKLAAAKDATNVKIGLLRNKASMTVSVELPPRKAPKPRIRMMGTTI